MIVVGDNLALRDDGKLTLGRASLRCIWFSSGRTEAAGVTSHSQPQRHISSCAACCRRLYSFHCRAAATPLRAMCVDEHESLTRGGLRAKKNSSHPIHLEDPRVESERASRENSPGGDRVRRERRCRFQEGWKRSRPRTQGRSLRRLFGKMKHKSLTIGMPFERRSFDQGGDCMRVRKLFAANSDPYPALRRFFDASVIASPRESR